MERFEMTTKTARDYQKEIGEWANHNFEYIDKIGLGIAEELGEYCHDLLKSKQKIRSHSVTEGGLAKLDECLKDSISDAMIYTLHYAEANNCSISFDESDAFRYKAHGQGHELYIVGLLFQIVGRMLTEAFQIEEIAHHRVNAQRVMNNLFWLISVKQYGHPIKDILAPTWEKVRQRDWIKYPKTGLQPLQNEDTD